MVGELKNFDPAEHLETDQDYAIYLEDSFQSGDPVVMLAALYDVSRSRNISALAREANLTREGFLKALRGNPKMETISKIADVLGYRLTLTPKEAVT